MVHPPWNRRAYYRCPAAGILSTLHGLERTTSAYGRRSRRGALDKDLRTALGQALRKLTRGFFQCQRRKGLPQPDQRDGQSSTRLSGPANITTSSRPPAAMAACIAQNPIG